VAHQGVSNNAKVIRKKGEIPLGQGGPPKKKKKSRGTLKGEKGRLKTLIKKKHTEEKMMSRAKGTEKGGGEPKQTCS